jgi:DNA polymerase-3 subunit gamma/tau
LAATTVLARKWRPGNFSQLLGQEHVVRALSNALAQGRLHHAYLFTGTRGVGKTTIARIYAKSLNCETGITATPCGVCNACREIESGRFVDLIELDAASNTQVDNMRELLESAMYMPNSGRFKIYIIDEVHMLSKSAFNAMLKTLEEPPAHVKFILATTDPQKIPVTVLSRCLQFNLKQLSPSLIASHLQYVLEQEQISFESAAVNLVARAAQGSMRDALSLLDQAIAFSGGAIEQSVVAAMLGAVDQSYLFDLLKALCARDGKALLQIADNMAARSIAFDVALQELAALLHQIAMKQTVPQAIIESVSDDLRLSELSELMPAEDVQLYYQIAIHGRDEIDLAPDQYAGYTMALLRMLAFSPDKSVISHARPMPVTGQVAINPAESRQVEGLKPDWGTLLAQLNLQSMAQQLAKHCVLESFVDEQMTLCLSQEFKHLQTKMACDKLQIALSQYFAKPIKLAIILGKIETPTPAIVEQNNRQAKQQQANDAIAQDSFVRDIQRELGANVLTDSIKPID